jgi:hypothetical protein
MKCLTYLAALRHATKSSGNEGKFKYLGTNEPKNNNELYLTSQTVGKLLLLLFTFHLTKETEPAYQTVHSMDDVRAGG